MAETYTHGIWLVRHGEEDAFVAAWREFASWGSTWPGCGTPRLVRDRYFEAVRGQLPAYKHWLTPIE